MKVSHLIEMLERYYTKDDYLVVAWWDKDWAEADLGRTFTTHEWEELAADTDIESDGLVNVVSMAFKDALEVMEMEDKQ